MEDVNKCAIELLEHALSVTLGEVSPNGKRELNDKWKPVLATNEDVKKYGSCKSTVNFMLFVREQLKKQQLLPRIPRNTKLVLKDSTSFRQGLLKEGDCIEYRHEFWMFFPLSARYELERPNSSYDFDFWDYSTINNTDDEENWIAFAEEKYSKETRERSHYYYNELDHYITYLVGAIKSGIVEEKNISEILDKHSEGGMTVMKMEIEEKYKHLSDSEKIELERTPKKED